MSTSRPRSTYPYTQNIDPRDIPRKVVPKWVIFTYWLAIFPAGTWLLLFIAGYVTFLGIPFSVAWKFIQDEPARTALWQGSTAMLHDRLNELGFEEDIKSYYRPKIQDEEVLDQHIHQILYDRTGYVGEDYYANSEGILVLREEYDQQQGIPVESVNP